MATEYNSLIVAHCAVSELERDNIAKMFGSEEFADKCKFGETEAMPLTSFAFYEHNIPAKTNLLELADVYRSKYRARCCDIARIDVFFADYAETDLEAEQSNVWDLGCHSDEGLWEAVMPRCFFRVRYSGYDYHPILYTTTTKPEYPKAEQPAASSEQITLSGDVEVPPDIAESIKQCLHAEIKRRDTEAPNPKHPELLLATDTCFYRRNIPLDADLINLAEKYRSYYTTAPNEDAKIIVSFYDPRQISLEYPREHADIPDHHDVDDRIIERDIMPYAILRVRYSPYNLLPAQYTSPIPPQTILTKGD